VGTDATRFYTEREGWCWWFGAIDHASDDIVGWHVAKIGDRCGERLEHVDRIRSGSRQRTTQGVEQRRARCDTADVARGHAVEELRGDLIRRVKNLFVHDAP
jgi:hypothetical protein